MSRVLCRLHSIGLRLWSCFLPRSPHAALPSRRFFPQADAQHRSPTAWQSGHTGHGLSCSGSLVLLPSCRADLDLAPELMNSSWLPRLPCFYKHASRTLRAGVMALPSVLSAVLHISFSMSTASCVPLGDRRHSLLTLCVVTCLTSLSLFSTQVSHSLLKMLGTRVGFFLFQIYFFHI